MFIWTNSNEIDVLIMPISIPKQNIPNMFLFESSAIPQLKMIVNQKAKIDDVWYSLGQEVSHYRISEITSNSVILKNSKKILVLKIQTRKPLQKKLETK